MEKVTPKIKVLDVETLQVLFECSLAESDKAYQFAASMENMGLTVKVVSPTLSQTLTNSLGLSAAEVAQYEKSMEEELEDHDGSCCFKDEDKDSLKH